MSSTDGWRVTQVCSGKAIYITSGVVSADRRTSVTGKRGTFRRTVWKSGFVQLPAAAALFLSDRQARYDEANRVGASDSCEGDHPESLFSYALSLSWANGGSQAPARRRAWGRREK